MVKMQKKRKKVGGGFGVVWSGQGRCERRIEVIVKIKKKVRGSGGGVGWSVWIEVIVKMKKIGGGPIRGGGGGGVRADVNEELKLL